MTELTIDQRKQQLLDTFPEATQRQLDFFLNNYCGSVNQTPLEFLKTNPSQERLESMFKAFLHPADVF
jgi:hypothetical protein